MIRRFDFEPRTYVGVRYIVWQLDSPVTSFRIVQIRRILICIDRYGVLESEE